MRRADEESFREFARQWIPSLRHTAYLLCGDWHLADDLVQTTGLKLFRAWSKDDRSQVPLNYARKVLVNSWLDERRRSWRRNEQASDSLPDKEVDGPSPADLYERQVTRGRLLRALATLPRAP